MLNVCFPPQLAVGGGLSWPLEQRRSGRESHMVLRDFRVGSLALALCWAGVAPASALCVRNVEAWDTLRMRAGPSPQAREVGAIPPNVCGVSVAGSCRGAWCPVVWRGRQGWSNAAYLSQGGFFDGFRVPSLGLLVPSPPVARYLPEPPRPVAAVRRAGPKRVASVSPPRPVEVARAPVRDVGLQVAPPAPRQVERVLQPAPPPVSAPPAIEASPAPLAPAPATAQTAVVVTPAPSVAAPPSTAAGGATSEVCVRNVAAGDTLKVRAGPGADQALRYGYPAGACGIKLTGACKEGWCPVDYRGYRGWAEQKFLK